jgi:actin-related protein 5
MPGRIDQPVAETGRNSPKPAPAKIWSLSEPPFDGYHAPDPQGYEHSNRSTAIVIDHGSSTIRAGWSFDSKPRVAIPPLWARYKDRKLNRYFTFIGSDVYSDGTARGQAKNIYEPGNNVVNNWDAVEGVLDYVLVKMGVDGNGSLERPVVMTEPVANMSYTRKSTLAV